MWIWTHVLHWFYIKNTFVLSLMHSGFVVWTAPPIPQQRVWTQRLNMLMKGEKRTDNISWTFDLFSQTFTSIFLISTFIHLWGKWLKCNRRQRRRNVCLQGAFCVAFIWLAWRITQLKTPRETENMSIVSHVLAMEIIPPVTENHPQHTSNCKQFSF